MANADDMEEGQYYYYQNATKAGNGQMGVTESQYAASVAKSQAGAKTKDGDDTDSRYSVKPVEYRPLPTPHYSYAQTVVMNQQYDAMNAAKDAAANDSNGGSGSGGSIGGGKGGKYPSSQDRAEKPVPAQLQDYNSGYAYADSGSGSVRVPAPIQKGGLGGDLSEQASLAYREYLLRQNEFAVSLDCSALSDSACESIRTSAVATPQLNTYYVVKGIADNKDAQNPPAVKNDVIKKIENVKPDVNGAIATGFESSMPGVVGDPTSTDDKKSLPPTSASSSLQRKQGFYKSIFGGVVGGGFSNMNMLIQQNNVNSTSGTTVWTAPIDYIPSVNFGLRLGMQYPAFSGSAIPDSFRWEFEIAYTRLQAKIGKLTPGSAGSNVSDLSAYPGFGNGNLISFMLNGAVDITKLGPGYPFLGAGIGIGVEIFDAYISPSFVAPMINGKLGYDVELDGGMVATVALSTTMLMKTNFYTNNSSSTGGAPFYQSSMSSGAGYSNYDQFGLQFLIELEFSLRFF